MIPTSTPTAQFHPNLLLLLCAETTQAVQGFLGKVNTGMYCESLQDNEHSVELEEMKYYE